MTPHYADPWLTVYQGDAREVLATLPAESVHCVVTSPPYWGLRDYGTPGQLGLEATPEAYVANMVEVFREVRRVLRRDGVVWLNMGDGYAAAQGGRQSAAGLMPTTVKRTSRGGRARNDVDVMGWGERDVTEKVLPTRATGLKPKDLIGMPWRLAFALQADGWYLRSDIVWAKPNPMPESVTDRPTRSHEYVFLLSRSARYFYDADAVRERESPNGPSFRAMRERFMANPERHQTYAAASSERKRADDVNNRRTAAGLYNTVGPVDGKRNLRSVWTIAIEPYPGAHFATFPRKLVEPCVKAGTSERGVCPECGAPWVRVVERIIPTDPGRGESKLREAAGLSPRAASTAKRQLGQAYQDQLNAAPPVTTGWRRSCAHEAEPVPAVVLDPFAGTGTTGLVAQALGRRAVLVDLNAEYLEQCLRRTSRKWGVGGRALRDDDAPTEGLWAVEA